jgi:FkbM family methyltransferase
MDDETRTEKKIVMANIPVEMECPITEVLAGEYESWFFGEDLTILDLGANVGSFTIWANLRWPRSRILAYEPHPETFKILTRNVEGLSNVVCHQAAVYPCEKERELFWARYPGDGEAGLTMYISRFFENLSPGSIFEVPILHPRDLPSCDIVKIDVEGGEKSILEKMNLEQVSLILIEYHEAEIRDGLKRLLGRDFEVVHEDSMKWDWILPNSEYRKTLKGDCFGRIFFHNTKTTKLRRGAPLPPRPWSLRTLLSALPKAARDAFWLRMKRATARN